VFEHPYNPTLPELKQTCSVCGKSLITEKRASIMSGLFQYDRCSCVSAKESQYLEILNQAELSLTAELVSRELSVVAPEPSRRATVGGVNFGERYKVVRLVGVGSMGRVIRIKDLHLDIELAAKVLHQHLITDSAASKRFAHEMARATQLITPHIVGTYESGMTSQGWPYAITDYLVGRNLAKELEDHGPIEPMRAINIFIQICSGLEHAHNKGVIHGDIKPSNVFLTNPSAASESVKIIDFGITRVTRTSDIGVTRLTDTAEIIGTPLYMCPEQCIGEPMSPLSDIYSLGCVMYECLSGKSPFAAENTVKIILRHLSEGGAKRLNQVLRPNTSLPPGLEQIIMNCLNRFPQKRYQSAKDLAVDLERVRDGKKPLIVVRPLRLPVFRIARRAQLIWVALTAVSCLLVLAWQFRAKWWPAPTAVTKVKPAVLDPSVVGMTLDQIVGAAHRAADPPHGVGDPKQAIFLYNQALAKVRALVPPDSGEEMNVLHGYGVDLIALGENNKACDIFEQGLAITSSHGSKQDKINFYRGLGTAQFNLGQLIESTNNTKEAADLSEQVNPISFETMSTANDMALRLYQRGSAYFDSAERWFQKVHLAAKYLIRNRAAVMIDGNAYQYEGLIADKQNKHDQAGRLFEYVLPFFEKFPGDGNLNLKGHYEVMAEHYRLVGDNSRAKFWDEKAVAVVKDAKVSEKSGTANKAQTDETAEKAKSAKSGGG
jgi:tetratricopeptide (TPR) repeat protein